MTSQVQSIVRSWFDFDQRFGVPVDLLVIACNTASISSAPALPEWSSATGVKAIGMLDAVRSLCESSSSAIRDRHVAVLATEHTVRSGRYAAEVIAAGAHGVTQVAATRSERLVARGLYGATECTGAIETDFESVEPAETVLLGCSCFEDITRELEQIYGGSTVFLNPADQLARLAWYAAGRPSIGPTHDAELLH